MNQTYGIILTTTSSKDEAERLAEMLVRETYAACVQIMAISSVYTWQDELLSEGEWLLMIKTKTDLYAQIESALEEHHSYEVPEIVCVPIIEGAEPYLSWVDANTKEIR
jgi:periplasmic divalent cation tolerance protein